MSNWEPYSQHIGPKQTGASLGNMLWTQPRLNSSPGQLQPRPRCSGLYCPTLSGLVSGSGPCTLLLARRGQNVAKNSATLCVEGRAGGLKSTVLRDGRPWTRPSSNTVLFFRGRPSLNTVLLWLRPSPNTQFSALQHVALFLATFWPLLASWSRVRQNDLHHCFCLGQTELLSPTCKIATGSL